ncbi:MAG: ComF family protein [Filifactoraceae bacterium]
MELIFPENLICIGCNDHISVVNKYSLCRMCYKKIQSDFNVCIKCGRILGCSNICFECENEKYYFDKIYSAFEYSEVAHHIIHIFKYGQGTFMARPLGNMLIDFLRDNNVAFDIITFVPLGKNRYRKRGYNQAELLALEIGGYFKIPVVSLFSRSKDTKFLSRLSGVQRRLEISGSFIVNSEIDLTFIEGRKILIVDDVFTTGATVNELSKILKKSVDVGEINIVTFANARKFVKEK